MRKKCVHATIGQRESNSERRDQAFFLFVLCFAATLLARQVHSYIQEHTQEAVLNHRLRNTRLGTESKVDISFSIFDSDTGHICIWGGYGQ